MAREIFIHSQLFKLRIVTFSCLIGSLKIILEVSHIFRNDKCLNFISIFFYRKVGFLWKENVFKNKKIKLPLEPKF